jgi:hypothetical protein
MLRTLPLLLVALAATVAPAPSRAASEQALSVVVSGAGSQVRNLSTYDTAAPVAVRVVAPLAHDAVVLATDPLGGNARTELQRDADGSWIGRLALSTAGTWTLAVATTGPHGNVNTTPSFSVAAREMPRQISPAILLALACLSICGGVGMIRVGRRAAASTAPEKNPTVA